MSFVNKAPELSQNEKLKFENYIWSGVNFIQKKLSKKSYPQISDLKILSRRVIQKYFIQINANLYHTNEANPLYIKEKRYFTVF